MFHGIEKPPSNFKCQASCCHEIFTAHDTFRKILEKEEKTLLYRNGSEKSVKLFPELLGLP
jgi:hypothetical protein